MKVNPRTMSTELPRRLQSCFGDEAVAACVKELDLIDLEASNADVCTSLEESLLAEFACFKACENFDCDDDAESVVKFSANFFPQEQRCGGVDAAATCNTGVFTGNGEDSLIPNECLVDADVEACMIKAGAVDQGNFLCDVLIENKVQEFACLNECDAFNCSLLGDTFFLAHGLSAAIVGCGDVDIEASCEAGRVIGAGEGLRAGTRIVLAVGALVFRMIR